jgi:hypothetical protein
MSAPATELLEIRNRRHGKTYWVTDVEWAEMEKKGNGRKVFEVKERKAITQPVPVRRTATMPPEVQEIEAKKAIVAPQVVETTRPQGKKGKATAAKGAEEHA